MTSYLQTAIEEAAGEAPPATPSEPGDGDPIAQPLYYTPRYAHMMDSIGGSKAPQDPKVAAVRDVLAFIRATAARQAKAPLTVAPSRFLDRLRSHYLKAYLAAPSPQAGVTAINGIGKPFAGVVTVVNAVPDRWEEHALSTWNKQPIPAGFRKLRPELPPFLAAATDILSVQNRKVLPAIDVPQLVGQLNLGTGFDDDWTHGGRNISQLMHWATGVKYAHLPALTMRELFLGYELWHLEGFDVFGEDSINDLIAEEQGRILGWQLRAGQISNDNLVAKLDEGFMAARAWVGTLIRARRAKLDEWILLEQPRPAKLWWGKLGMHQLWGPQTLLGMLRSGMSVDAVKRSPLCKKITDIYTLVYAADEWERSRRKVPSTKFLDSMLRGDLDSMFQKLAKEEKLSIGEMRRAAKLAGAPTS